MAGTLPAGTGLVNLGVSKFIRKKLLSASEI
jgi:hypothetical protein